MKKYISLCLFLMIFLNNLNAQVKSQVDVVYLKNGNVVKGTLIKDIPNVEIQFQTLDGSFIIYPYDDFTKLGKEENTKGKKNTIPTKVAENKVAPDKTIQSTTLKKDSTAVILADPNDLFIIGGIAAHLSQNSGFIMAGKVKKYGGYVKLKTNFNFNDNYAETDSSNVNRYFTGKTQKGRYAATAGVLIRVIRPLIAYVGGGYGNRWVNWETVEGNQFRVIDISYKGAEVEAGFIYKIKKLMVSGGASVNSFKFWELNIGIGITL